MLGNLAVETWWWWNNLVPCPPQTRHWAVLRLHDLHNPCNFLMDDSIISFISSNQQIWTRQVSLVSHSAVIARLIIDGNLSFSFRRPFRVLLYINYVAPNPPRSSSALWCRFSRVGTTEQSTWATSRSERRMTTDYLGSRDERLD